MKRDMSQLYSRLGLRPGCTLEEFKYAYLRRIAELHPDHSHGAVRDASALSELVWLYATASRFHRRHGRLPGATGPAATPRAARQPQSRAQHAAMPVADIGNPMGVKEPKSRSERPLHMAALMLPLAAVLLLMFLSSDWLTPASRPSSGETPPPSADQSPQWLEPGMAETAVLAVQGDPSKIQGERWLYGPSWVQFENGRLVDWYSAPQHPLKIAVDVLAPGDVRAGIELH